MDIDAFELLLIDGILKPMHSPILNNYSNIFMTN